MREIIALLGCYAELIVIDVSGQHTASIFKGSAVLLGFFTLELEPIGCPERSVTDHRSKFFVKMKTDYIQKNILFTAIRFRVPSKRKALFLKFALFLPCIDND